MSTSIRNVGAARFGVNGSTGASPRTPAVGPLGGAGPRQSPALESLGRGFVDLGVAQPLAWEGGGDSPAVRIAPETPSTDPTPTDDLGEPVSVGERPRDDAERPRVAEKPSSPKTAADQFERTAKPAAKPTASPAARPAFGTTTAQTQPTLTSPFIEVLARGTGVVGAPPSPLPPLAAPQADPGAAAHLPYSQLGQLGSVVGTLAASGSPAPRRIYLGSMLVMSDAQRHDLPGLEPMANVILRGNLQATSEHFAAWLRSSDRVLAAAQQNVAALVQQVLRESYLMTTDVLRDYAEKVQFYNEQKKALRDALTKHRAIKAELASVASDKAGVTRLDGSLVPGANDGSVPKPKTPDGGPPLITDVAQRDRDYPEGKLAVSEFLGYLPRDGRTDLEEYFKASPEAIDRLVAAIPYMTVRELYDVLVAFGGSDMKVDKDVTGVWARAQVAMSDEQVLSLATMHFERNTGRSNYNVVVGVATGSLGPRDFEDEFEPGTFIDQGGEFQPGFVAALNRARARVEIAAKKTFGEDYAGAAKAAHEIRRAELEAAKTGVSSDANETESGKQPGGVESAPEDGGAIDEVTVVDAPPYIATTGKKIETVAQLDAELKALEEKLSSLGDDAQLANVDLQNELQKQQQTLQMMSNISKMLYDTAMAVVRKIGG